METPKVSHAILNGRECEFERGVSILEALRARAMIEIAHPDHRARLEHEAQGRFKLFRD